MTQFNYIARKTRKKKDWLPHDGWKLTKSQLLSYLSYLRECVCVRHGPCLCVWFCFENRKRQKQNEQMNKTIQEKIHNTHIYESKVSRIPGKGYYMCGQKMKYGKIGEIKLSRL